LAGDLRPHVFVAVRLTQNINSHRSHRSAVALNIWQIAAAFFLA